MYGAILSRIAISIRIGILATTEVDVTVAEGQNLVALDPVEVEVAKGRVLEVRAGGPEVDERREMLWVIATLDHPDEEFTIQELVAATKQQLVKSFSPSHANQMLASLGTQGLVYKNRFGKYSFAVPLLNKFILRRYGSSPSNVFQLPF